MQIATGGGDVGVSKSGLDQVDRGSAVKSMACVGVTQPMRRYRTINAGLSRRAVNDAADLRDIELAISFAAREHRVGGTGIAFERHQFLPNSTLEEDRSSLAALAKHGDLTSLLTGKNVAPLQATE